MIWDMHPTQNLKPNIAPDFIFAYGCRNPEVVVIYSGFRYLKGHFCTSFKLPDDHIHKWVMSSKFPYPKWCVVNGVEDKIRNSFMFVYGFWYLKGHLCYSDKFLDDEVQK